MPVSTVITGIDSEKILDQALEAERTFKRLGVEQVEAILAKAARVKTPRQRSETAH
ncbi:MAG: hypothetical protein M0018_04855 [Nitrospiraceae bacterium]|nr:hypothetical protein [Nitrospiraceae bacterium]